MPTKPRFRFSVANFRSVESGTLDLRPITVLTGANGAGKSSFIYGLLVLKNMLINSNQPLDNFFNLGFMNLGGFKEVIAEKRAGKNIYLGAFHSDDIVQSSYLASLGTSSSLGLEIRRPFALDCSLSVSFPYLLTQSAAYEIMWEGKTYNLRFNGIDVEVLGTDGSRVPERLGANLQRALRPVSLARTCDYVDVKRGFFRNMYVSVPAGVYQNPEEELASILANDRDLEAGVSVILERMLGKSFAVRQTVLGVSTFYLQTRDPQSGFVCDLVNEGFGINQLVYLLAKILQRDRELICIEEPEAHLHPEVLSKLAEQFLRIAKMDNKSFLIASHSENFVVSLLNLIAQGKASLDDIGLYFVAKDENNRTRVAEQKVNEKGQIEGGLRSFYEPSIRALEEFLGSEPDPAHVNPAK